MDGARAPHFSYTSSRIARFAYPFEVRDDSDWMARHFFTGGVMPSDDLLLYFQRDVVLLTHWQVPGWHYQLTSEAWLANMDRHRAELMPVLERTYGTAPGAALVGVLARVLHVLRGTLGISRRPRMAGIALPV